MIFQPILFLIKISAPLTIILACVYVIFEIRENNEKKRKRKPRVSVFNNNGRIATGTPIATVVRLENEEAIPQVKVDSIALPVLNNSDISAVKIPEEKTTKAISSNNSRSTATNVTPTTDIDFSQSYSNQLNFDNLSKLISHTLSVTSQNQDKISDITSVDGEHINSLADKLSRVSSSDGSNSIQLSSHSTVASKSERAIEPIKRFSPVMINPDDILDLLDEVNDDDSSSKPFLTVRSSRRESKISQYEANLIKKKSIDSLKRESRPLPRVITLAHDQ